jgi:ABC-type uncharacterized transport system substrate-binding protein
VRRKHYTCYEHSDLIFCLSPWRWGHSEAVREFITVLGSTLAWPLGAHAQQAKIPMIGFISTDRLEGQEKSIAAFHRGLGEVGYNDGRNVAIEYRVAEDHVDRLAALAADLVSRQVAAPVATRQAGSCDNCYSWARQLR